MTFKKSAITNLNDRSLSRVFFITYLTNDSAVMYRQWLGFNHGKPTGCCLVCPGLPVKVSFGTFEGNTSMVINGGGAHKGRWVGIANLIFYFGLSILELKKMDRRKASLYCCFVENACDCGNKNESYTCTFITLEMQQSRVLHVSGNITNFTSNRLCR
jgi:hypothetical protein